MLLGILYFLLALVSLILIGLILIQDSKAGGLSAAFTGSETIVGAAGGKEITRFTAYLAAAFIILCTVVGVLKRQGSGTSVAQDAEVQSSVEQPADGAPGAGTADGTPGAGAPEAGTPAAGTPEGGTGTSPAPPPAGETGTEGASPPSPGGGG